MKFLRTVSPVCVVLAFAVTALASGRKPHIRFASAVAYNSAGPEADSVVIADVNRDGIPDVVIANYCQSLDQYGHCTGYGEVAVLLGNGDGTFQPAVTYSTGAYHAYSVAVADGHGDSIPDLVVADLCQSVDQSSVCIPGSPGEVGVLLGNGDGTFQPAETYNSGGFLATSVAAGDVNGDGYPDLVVANSCASNCGGGNGGVSVLLGNGDGTFQPAQTYNSGGYYADSVVIADVNRDGHPDLVVLNECESYECDPDGYGAVSVLLNNGDGTFQPAVTYNSGGHFADSVAVGDLKSDGILDLVVAYQCAGNHGGGGCPTPDAVGVLLGNGDGTFHPATSYSVGGWQLDSVAIGDVNGDGHPDLVVVSECQGDNLGTCIGTGEVAVLLGNGDGTFQAPIKYGSGGYEGSAIAIGDVNGDGRPDIVVTNACGSGCSGNEGSVAVLLNETYYRSKTVLSSSPNPSQVNQTVTFTATITPTPPNGEVVKFYNGKASIGTGKTANGVATLTTSFSKAKTYTIKASYPGDPFRKASSGTVKQVVN